MDLKRKKSKLLLLYALKTFRMYYFMKAELVTEKKLFFHLLFFLFNLFG